MLQKIKDILKKILPPPTRVFHREITRILDSIAGIRKTFKAAQDQTASEFRLSHKNQQLILSELAAMRKQQEQMITELVHMRKEYSQLHTELHQELSLKIQKNEEAVSQIAQDTITLQRLIEKQGAELSGHVQRQGHRVIQKIDRLNRHAENLPIISVLIPVYNVAPYLRDCLDSVINQSMKEIEIICVDDGSTDSSGSILDEYAGKDHRIKVIHKRKNEGLLLARKSAVEAAVGEYLLFVDSDDCIDSNLCAFAEEITKTEYADIIQFGANVCDYSNNEKKVAWLRRALMPIDKELSSSDVLKEAYVSRSYITSLLGKLYKTALCKKAYADLPDTHCYVGEDIFTYFFLAHYAQSYKGIPTQAYYTYRHGLGVTNTETMPLEKFELYCSMAKFDRYIYDRLICESTDSALLESYAGMVRRIATDCCNIYAYRMRDEDKDAALKMLISYWGDSPIANEAAQKILGFPLRQCPEK